MYFWFHLCLFVGYFFWIIWSYLPQNGQKQAKVTKSSRTWPKKMPKNDKKKWGQKWPKLKSSREKPKVDKRWTKVAKAGHRYWALWLTSQGWGFNWGVLLTGIRVSIQRGGLVPKGGLFHFGKAIWSQNINFRSFWPKKITRAIFVA